MSGSTRSRQKPKLEPISLDELAGTTGMSGFCSFLTRDMSQAVPALDHLQAEPSPDAKLTPGDNVPSADNLAPATKSVSPVANLPSEDIVASDVNLTSADTVASPVNLIPGDTFFVLEDGTPVDARFVRRHALGQHGHTASEHLVYMALWEAGGAGDLPYRDVSIGQTVLARVVNVSKRNLIRILASLEEKLSIDVLQSQISADHVAKKYRVWNLPEILERRQQRGFEGVYRNRNAVALVRGAILTPGDKLASRATP